MLGRFAIGAYIGFTIGETIKADFLSRLELGEGILEKLIASREAAKDAIEGTPAPQTHPKPAPSESKRGTGTATKQQDQSKNACFAAGTPVLTLDGYKPIEKLQPGDKVLARPEEDVRAKAEFKVVEDAFVAASPVIRVRVQGRDIRTTAEHPFFVVDQGWRPASALRPGDLLSSHDGQVVAVDEVGETGEEVPVYNVRIADYHTYFVGCEDWGFSVWAHNTCLVHYTTQKGLAGILASKTILASTGIVNARYGDGQYFTDIFPFQVTNRKAAGHLGRREGSGNNIDLPAFPASLWYALECPKGSILCYREGD